MTAKELISYSIEPLRTSDTGDAALAMMNLYHVRHMPIVNNKMLLGIISDDFIMNNDILEPIGSYPLTLIRAYCRQKEHLFEIMGRMAEYKLSIIPVVDDEDNYMGVITQEDLIRYFAHAYSFEEAGSILLLEVAKVNYSLSEISRIAEDYNATIISSFITKDPNTSNLLVTIKINTKDIGRIVASFERYDYRVRATFMEEENAYGLRDRYDSLMNYLSV